MISNPPKNPRSTAITQLEALGLSAYAARTYIALTSLGKGTAQDVSDVSDVPRTRVYDAVDELHERGLVDVQQSTPKQFWAVSSETVCRHFNQQFTATLDGLSTALEALEADTGSVEQRGVWTVTGRTNVTSRLIESIESATDEIVLMTVEELLTEEVLSGLRAANERGVTIRLAGSSSDVEDRVRTNVPDAKLFESMWAWAQTPAGRLLMVDDSKTLVSVLLDGNGDHPPEALDETAIWGSGANNSLVMVLRALFTWQLRDVDD